MIRPRQTSLFPRDAYTRKRDKLSLYGAQNLEAAWIIWRDPERYPGLPREWADRFLDRCRREGAGEKSIWDVGEPCGRKLGGSWGEDNSPTQILKGLEFSPIFSAGRKA